MPRNIAGLYLLNQRKLSSKLTESGESSYIPTFCGDQSSKGFSIALLLRSFVNSELVALGVKFCKGEFCDNLCRQETVPKRLENVNVRSGTTDLPRSTVDIDIHRATKATILGDSPYIFSQIRGSARMTSGCAGVCGISKGPL